MDQVIEQEVTARKKKKGIMIAIIAIAVLAGAIWLMRSTLKSSVSRSEITTAVVGEGSVENTLNATGEVLPEFEEILTSPINASIKSVVMDAGNKVAAGQSILALDKSAAQTEFEKSTSRCRANATRLPNLSST
jgi:HlyD family secretion protein